MKRKRIFLTTIIAVLAVSCAGAVYAASSKPDWLAGKESAMAQYQRKMDSAKQYSVDHPRSVTSSESADTQRILSEYTGKHPYDAYHEQIADISAISDSPIVLHNKQYVFSKVGYYSDDAVLFGRSASDPSEGVIFDNDVTKNGDKSYVKTLSGSGPLQLIGISKNNFTFKKSDGTTAVYSTVSHDIAP